MSETASSLVKFQVSIAGYNGPATTLHCVIIKADNMLVIADEFPLEEARREGFGMVTNLDLHAVDYRFSDELLRDAIQAYNTRQSQQTVDVLEKLARYSPSNAITNDGYDERGPRYRINPEITNGQVAVLAACAFADVQAPVNKALAMMDDITALYQLTTI